MPGGGTLTITVEDIEVDAALAADVPCDHTGAHVVLSVADTGTGMDEVTRGRPFEPFFTTKEEGGVRHMARRMLESSGYTVLTARNAGEALLLLERHDTPIHLIGKPSTKVELTRIVQQTLDSGLENAPISTSAVRGHTLHG